MLRLETENPELAENAELDRSTSSSKVESSISLDEQMDTIFAYSRARQEFETGRNEVMEGMASLNESLDEYGRKHPNIEKYSNYLVNSVGVVAMAGIVWAAPEVGLVATMGSAASFVAYGELFNYLIENGSDKFVEYCALQGRTEAESVRYGTAAAGIVGKMLTVVAIRGGIKMVKGKTSSKDKIKSLSKTEAEALSKHVFKDKTANENLITTKITEGINEIIHNDRHFLTGKLRTSTDPGKNVKSVQPLPNTTNQSKPVRNIGEAGKYKEMIEPGPFHDGMQAHHMPSQAWLKAHQMNTKKGFTAIMTEEQHAKTRTYKGGGRKIDTSSDYRSEIGKDLSEYIRILKADGSWTPEVRGSLKRGLDNFRKEFPDLFEKVSK